MVSKTRNVPGSSLQRGLRHAACLLLAALACASPAGAEDAGSPRLMLTEPGLLESIRAFMSSRSASIHPNLHALLHAATFAAQQSAEPAQREAIFKNMGHIAQVKDEISFYAHAARLHDIHLIGEIGFNAGHSAITMLYQTHHTKLISFDTMDLPWSTLSLEFVQGMYPHRVERVKGSSIDTVGVFAKTDERKFDLFCIDGMHSGVFPYQDMLNGRNASRPGAFVVIDDYSNTFPDVKVAWARAQKEGWIYEIICVDKTETGEPMVVDGYIKGYCLGQYAA